MRTHWIVGLILSLAVSLAAVPVHAQTDPPEFRGSVLVAYNLADLQPGAMADRASGWQLEGDVKLPGTVLSIVGHVSDHGEVEFRASGRA